MTKRFAIVAAAALAAGALSINFNPHAIAQDQHRGQSGAGTGQSGTGAGSGSGTSTVGAQGTRAQDDATNRSSMNMPDTAQVRDVLIEVADAMIQPGGMTRLGTHLNTADQSRLGDQLGQRNESLDQKIQQLRTEWRNKYNKDLDLRNTPTALSSADLRIMPGTDISDSARLAGDRTSGGQGTGTSGSGSTGSGTPGGGTSGTGASGSGASGSGASGSGASGSGASGSGASGTSGSGSGSAGAHAGDPNIPSQGTGSSQRGVTRSGPGAGDSIIVMLRPSPTQDQVAIIRLNQSPSQTGAMDRGAAGGAAGGAASGSGGAAANDPASREPQPAGDRQQPQAKWTVDVPDSIDAKQLQQSLSKHIDMVIQEKNQWPADESKAYGVVTQHILMAVAEPSGAGQGDMQRDHGQQPGQPGQPGQSGQQPGQPDRR